MSFYFLKPHEFMTPDERLEIFQTDEKCMKIKIFLSFQISQNEI